MRFENVAILSVASVDPPNRIPSTELEASMAPFLKRLGFASGMIASLSGVVARRFWDRGTQPSDAAVLAARNALAKAGVAPSAVGMLVNTSVSRDFVEPSTASLVHRGLGLASSCLNFDLSNACLGFINGLDVVALSIERGVIDVGLVVAGESCRHVVEKTLERLNAEGDVRAFSEHFATLTLGSGAAAMVLARADRAPADAHRYVGSVSLAASEHNHLCRGQVDAMITDGKGLLAAGLDLAAQTFERACAELGWTASSLDQFAVHQVSRQHTDKLAARLGLDLARVHAIFPEHGNVGPASIPIVIAQLESLGRLAKGQRVALMGIGSGLNCAMAEVVW